MAEKIEETIEKAGLLSNKITKFILILMTAIGTIIGAYYTLKEDVQEKKQINIPTAIDSLDSVFNDSLKIDTNAIK